MRTEKSPGHIIGETGHETLDVTLAHRAPGIAYQLFIRFDAHISPLIMVERLTIPARPRAAQSRSRAAQARNRAIEALTCRSPS